MTVLGILFFFALVLVQLAGISIAPGVVVYPHEILLTTLLVLSIFHGHGKRYRRLALFPPIALFIGIIGISLLVNSAVYAPEKLAVSALYGIRFCVYALLIVIVAYTQRVRFWLRGLYATGVMIGVLGLMQFVLYPDLRNVSYLGWDPHYQRLFSTFLDPNFTGLYLVLTLCLSLVFRRTWWMVGSQLVLLFSLVLTFSRSSYVSFLVALGIVAFMSKQWRGAGFGLMVAMLVFISIPRPSGEGGNLFRTVSTYARVGNWQRSIPVIWEAPLLGHGFNTLRYVAIEHGWGDEEAQISKAGGGVDSSVLFILLTTGVVGLGSYLWILWTVIGLARTQKEKRVTLAVYAALGALGVHSIFSNSLFYPWVMAWLWIVVGVLERKESPTAFDT